MILRLRRALGNTLLLIVSTFVALMVGELSVRFFLYDSITLFPRYHTAATYDNYSIRKLLPNASFRHTSVDGSWRFTTNAQGFRDDHDYTYPKPSDTIRVISLGDSHTLGFEVNQDSTYSSIIASRLRDRGVAVEVLNTGISGFGTAEELVFLENEGLKYKPDFVVLGFFANDIQDNLKSDLFRLDDGLLIEGDPVHLPGVRVLDTINRFFLLRWLSEHSYLYSLVMNSGWNLAKSLLLSQRRTQLETEYAAAVTEPGEYELNLTQLLLKRLYSFCSTNDIYLIIVDIPQVDGSGFRSSIPNELLDTVRSSSHYFLNSSDLFSSSAHSVFVPHGQRHISQEAHWAIGDAVAQTVLSARRTVSAGSIDN